MTGKVVTTPIKVDFHIHSAASAHKDKDKVKEGIEANLPILVEKLNQHGVNAAAITDHDAFDYDLYMKFSSYADGSGSLIKVFPGIEFSVMFSTKDGQKPVHVVTLFDDSDNAAVKRIESLLPSKNGSPDYDAGSAFSESRYWEIIRSIGLDIIAIAHQKNSPSSKTIRKNDANSVGEETFNEFLSMEYFEAYEYKNRRNELFNKHFTQQIETPESLRFITGSDCHQWSSYPAVFGEKEDDLPFTYLKCLPTFRGLAMAITDSSRINTTGSFFSASASTVDAINLVVDGVETSITLSPGINAIIGDNSIGKSSLVNAMTGFRNVPAQVKKGQQKYLEKEKIEITTTLQEDQLGKFDGQEEIRKLFADLSEGKARGFLAEHFPQPIDPEEYLVYARTQIALLCGALKASCEYQDALSELGALQLPPAESLEPPMALIFKNNLKVEVDTAHQACVDDIKKIEQNIDSLSKLHRKVLDEEDAHDLEIVRQRLGLVRQRHEQAVRGATREHNIANAICTTIGNIKARQGKETTDSQKRMAVFVDRRERFCESVANMVQLEQNVHDFEFDFEPLHIEPRINTVGELAFISKLEVEILDPKLLTDVFTSLLNSSKTIEMQCVSSEQLRDAIKRYPDDQEGKHPADIVRERMEKDVENRLKETKAINRAGDDVFKELSQGFNAQIYFSLLADVSNGDGIYIVDQPEDQISQKAIRDAVLNEFRKIAAVRQVLLVTHNPQFIVNLDVDNVIFLRKGAHGLEILSGALEYECDQYKILDVVANNVEGGLDTVQRRMKRYEKAN